MALARCDSVLQTHAQPSDARRTFSMACVLRVTPSPSGRDPGNDGGDGFRSSISPQLNENCRETLRNNDNRFCWSRSVFTRSRRSTEACELFRRTGRLTTFNVRVRDQVRMWYSTSDARPLGPVGKPRAGHDALTGLLRAGPQALLVDGTQVVVLNDFVSVDEHGVHAAAVGRVHELVGHVQQRRPFGSVPVVQHKIVPLARLDRSQLVLG